jgi:transketolase
VAFGGVLQDLLAREPERPKLVVADTVKGAGAMVFEPHDLEHSGTALYAFHSGAPDPDRYEAALAEILGRLRERLGGEVELEEAPAPRRQAPSAPQKLVDAYGSALADAAGREERLVALDADLYLDCGLIPFRERCPERFVECGIAEQDMVSQAGALALGGMLPAVHSFACFLTPRASEQVFNNASEGTRVLYAGMLAGIVPGGPGHSHQSVRDIALMGSVPGMACLEPATEEETRRCVEWAVFEADGPVYVRFVSVPWELGFEPPCAAGPLQRGRGTVVREGERAAIVCTGPVLLSQAWVAAEEAGDVAVIALPWLRDVDGAWLAEVTGGAPVLVLDNHVARGGQGDAVRAALDRPVEGIAVEDIPACGANEEVLRHHGLDAASIAARLRALTGVAA